MRPELRGLAGEDLLPRPSDQRGHGDGPQVVGEPVEVDQQQPDAGGDGDPGRGDADVGHVVILDATQQRVRERARERREHRLLQPVAVPPQPHIPRGQRARGLLHDDHADRHHEAISATMAPTIAVSTPLAVDAE